MSSFPSHLTAVAATLQNVALDSPPPSYPVSTAPGDVYDNV